METPNLRNSFLCGHIGSTKERGGLLQYCNIMIKQTVFLRHFCTREFFWKVTLLLWVFKGGTEVQLFSLFSLLTFNISRSSSSYSRWCEVIEEDVLTVFVSVAPLPCLSGFVCLVCSRTSPITASPTAQITTSTKHPEENTPSLIPDCSILSIQRHRLPFRDSRLPK